MFTLPPFNIAAPTPLFVLLAQFFAVKSLSRKKKLTNPWKDCSFWKSGRIRETTALGRWLDEVRKKRNKTSEAERGLFSKPRHTWRKGLGVYHSFKHCCSHYQNGITRGWAGWMVYMGYGTWGGRMKVYEGRLGLFCFPWSVYCVLSSQSIPSVLTDCKHIFDPMGHVLSRTTMPKIEIQGLKK